MHILPLLVFGAILAPTASSATAPQTPPAPIRFENRSNAPYEGWAYATLPIPPGLVQDARILSAITLADPVSFAPIETVATPLKWHWSSGARTSVALASVRARVQIGAQSNAEYRVVMGPNATGDFVWDPELIQWIGAAPIGNDVFVLARFAGDPETYVARPPGQMRTLDRNSAAYLVRGRTRFRQVSDPNVSHALTLTSYWSLQSGEGHGNVTMVVGNDTLERPVSGGIQITQLALLYRLPFLAVPKAQLASGVSGPLIHDGYAIWTMLENQSLADGQTFAADFSFCVTHSSSSRAFRSMLASADSPLVGLADFGSWRASQAAGPVGFVPLPRFTDVVAARAALAGTSTLTTARPTDDFNIVNRNPPGTGDQPDFMSNIPVFYLQAVQTGSSLPLTKALVAAKRECWRPSNYFDNTRGYAERVSLLNYPDLFFWNGRPHYDQSWNTQYPTWTTRANGFVVGNTSGWSGMDNQHFGHNAVRSAYELTADPYLGELLRANMSILYWDFFTDWMQHTEAERTGRLVKEATLLCALFPDAPEAAPLRAAIAQKLGVFANTAQYYLNLYNFPAIASVRNDARVPLTQQFPNQDVHMSWQSGFHMEALALAARVLGDANARWLLQTYLDRAHLLFLPDGTPKTYTLMSNPSQCSTGGIGVEWWSGWVLADRAVASHQNRALFDQQITPRLRQVLTPAAGTLWWAKDRWRCFE